MEQGLLAGVDIGGTKVAVGVATAEGRVVATRREGLAAGGGVEVVAQAIRLLEEVRGEAASSEIASVGVAVPAVTDAAQQAVLWAPNIPGWQERIEVAGPIAQAVGAPVSLHYDGHAWGMGEWWCGAAQGAKEVGLIAVGTGIGGCVILDGRLHRGRIGVAGAVGWWVPDWRLVGRERRRAEGWLESVASGPAIAKAAGCETAEAAFAAARGGEQQAQAAVARAAQALGAAAANLVSLLDPEIVIFGGGVMAGGADLLLPRIEQIVRREAQPQMAEGVRIEAAALGEEAGWLGAARLASERPVATDEHRWMG